MKFEILSCCMDIQIIFWNNLSGDSRNTLEEKNITGNKGEKNKMDEKRGYLNDNLTLTIIDRGASLP